MKKQLKILAWLLSICLIISAVMIVPMTASADTAVCQIGSTTYTTIQAAVDAAAEGDTITMIADYNTGAPNSALATITKNNLTLDLAGFTVSDNSQISFSSGAADGIIVNSGIKFTLTSSVAGGKIYKANRKDAWLYVIRSNANSDVTISNVELYGTGTANNGPILNTADGSKLTVEDCKITGIKTNGASMSAIHGVYVNAASTVSVKGTTFSMCASDITVSNAGAVVTVEDSTLLGNFERDGTEGTCLRISAGTVNVTNTTLTSTATKSQTRTMIISGGTTNLTGCQITSKANVTPIYISGAGTMNIYDGTHAKTTGANSLFVVTDAGAVVNLYGGEFECKSSFLSGGTNASSFVLKDDAKAANENNVDITSTYLTSVDSEYVRITTDDLDKIVSALFVIEGSSDSIFDGETWEAGQYNYQTGLKEAYGDRYRISNLLDVVGGMSYKFSLGTTNALGYQYVLRGYDKNGTFVKSLGTVANNASFTIPDGVEKISVTLYNDSVAAGTTNKYLTNGTFTPTCTGSTATIGTKYSDDKGNVTLWQTVAIPGKNTFVGWKDASGKIYSANAPVVIDSTTTFTAVGLNLTMSKGAGVRWAQSHDDRGIRFQTNIKKSDLEALTTAGATTTTGTIIAPYTSSVTADSFTIDGLAAIEGQNVVNTGNSLYKTNDYFYGGIKGMCILKNPAEQTQHEDSSKVVTTKLAARGYLSVTYSDGSTNVFYTAFSTTDNVRSMQEIASAALADTTITYSQIQKDILTIQYGATATAADYLKESGEDANVQ